MNNRNYFTNPNQGGSRSSYDYGHTRITEDRCGTGFAWWIVPVIVVLTVIGYALT